MSNPASNLTALKDAIVPTFGSLVTADVSDQEPVNKSREVVWFGGASITQVELTMPSTAVGSKQEEIRLRGFVEVNQGGDSEKESRDDAFAILATLNDYLRASPDLGGAAPGVLYAAIFVTTYDPIPEEEGFAVRVEFDLYAIGNI